MPHTSRTSAGGPWPSCARASAISSTRRCRSTEKLARRWGRARRRSSCGWRSGRGWRGRREDIYMTDSNEIREQIEQEKDLLRILRNNRHHLAMQQAKLGGAPDLSLINQIDWHDTQIDLHEQ